MNPAAHDGLSSHGWQHLGETHEHGLRSSGVDAYAHPNFGGGINVASVGEWQHTNAANANMPAHGGTAR